MMFNEPHEVPMIDLSVGVMPGVESSILLHKAVVSPLWLHHC